MKRVTSRHGRKGRAARDDTDRVEEDKKGRNGKDESERA